MKRSIGVSALLAISVFLFVPSLATAKTVKGASRITSGNWMFTVDNADASATPAPPVFTGRLSAYRRSVHRYVAVSGRLKLYSVDAETGHLTYISSEWRKAGSSFAFPLTTRGEYRVRFAGSAKVKPCEAEAVRYDSIVSAPPTLTVTFEDVGGGYTRVSITETVAWNATAYTGSALLQTLWESSDTSSTTVPVNVLGGEFGMTLASCPRPDTYSMSTTVRTSDLSAYVLAACAVTFAGPGSGPSFVTGWSGMTTPTVVLVPK